MVVPYCPLRPGEWTKRLGELHTAVLTPLNQELIEMWRMIEAAYGADSGAPPAISTCMVDFVTVNVLQVPAGAQQVPMLLTRLHATLQQTYTLVLSDFGPEKFKMAYGSALQSGARRPRLRLSR